jgi:hypothetical protein
MCVCMCVYVVHVCICVRADSWHPRKKLGTEMHICNFSAGEEGQGQRQVELWRSLA